MANNDSSRRNVSVCSDDENYDELYNAFQELFYELESMFVAYSKLKYEYKALQKNFETSLEEVETLNRKFSILKEV